MIIVVLAQDDIINGKLYVAGQRVRVPDNYANIRRVVGTIVDVRRRNHQWRFDVALPKILERLAEFPAWQHLPEKRKNAIMERLRNEPDLLNEAIKSPGQLLKGGGNGR